MEIKFCIAFSVLVAVSDPVAIGSFCCAGEPEWSCRLQALMLMARTNPAASIRFFISLLFRVSLRKESNAKQVGIVKMRQLLVAVKNSRELHLIVLQKVFGVNAGKILEIFIEMSLIVVITLIRYLGELTALMIQQ